MKIFYDLLRVTLVLASCGLVFHLRAMDHPKQKLLWTEQDKNGCTEFMDICLENDVEVVQVILSSAGQDVMKLLKIRNTYEQSVLHKLIAKIAYHHNPTSIFVEEMRENRFDRDPGEVYGTYRILISPEKVTKHYCGKLITSKTYRDGQSRFLLSGPLGVHFCGKAVVMAILQAISNYVYYHIQCSERYTEVLSFFALKDFWGKTALDIAKECNLVEEASILERHEQYYRSKAT